MEIENERGMAKLPTAILPKRLQDPGPEEIQNFIINSPDLSPESFERTINSSRKSP